jgi:ParB-like chromosome segregation protein Spo0J
MVAPIVVKPGEGPHRFTDVSGKIITAENIDGHHRYFIAQLLQRPTIDALIGEPANLQRKTLHREKQA